MERVYTEDAIRFMENGTEKAALQEKVEGESIQISLSGAISGDITHTLLDEMTALIVAGQGITVNLESASYLAPSVMDTLLQMEKRLEEKGKIMRLIQMPQPIYDDFKARGMHEMLEIEVKKA